MKVELLKNKQTSIIEKIIINKGLNTRFKSVPFNITHSQTMVELDTYDLEWHELIMDYSCKTSPLDIRLKLYKEYESRELDYLITILDSVHRTKFTSFNKGSVEAWFFNYYIWALFYIVSSELRKTKRMKSKLKVVDPTILLFADGINTLRKYEVFYDGKKAKSLFDGICNHQFYSSFDELHKVFSTNKYNNEKINLEIFKKEVMKLNKMKDHNYIYWNSKKRMIRELIIDLIDEKIHYSA